MKIGLIGRGPWGAVYAKTLAAMGIEFWQSGRDWRNRSLPDAAIIACAPDAHYEVAKSLLIRGVPVLIEKPVCDSYSYTQRLMSLAKFMGGIVFVGHTRLYSNAWREFKAKAQAEGVKSVYAVAGGKCKLAPLWDWGPHLIAMCLDLGFDPDAAHIITGEDEWPLKFVVNGTMTFTDQQESPSPLEVLITEFLAAAAAKKTDLRGMELGVKVADYIRRNEKKKMQAAHGA